MRGRLPGKSRGKGLRKAATPDVTTKPNARIEVTKGQAHKSLVFRNEFG
jgi:hypothetical protein